MPRVVEGKSQLATQIDADLHESLRSSAELYKVPIAELVEEGIVLALRERLRKDRERLAALEEIGMTSADLDVMAQYAFRKAKLGECPRCFATLLLTDERCTHCGLENPNHPQTEANRVALDAYVARKAAEKGAK